MPLNLVTTRPVQLTPEEHWAQLVSETEEEIQAQMKEWRCDREYVVTIFLREAMGLDIRKPRQQLRLVK